MGPVYNCFKRQQPKHFTFNISDMKIGSTFSAFSPVNTLKSSSISELEKLRKPLSPRPIQENQQSVLKTKKITCLILPKPIARNKDLLKVESLPNTYIYKNHAYDGSLDAKGRFHGKGILVDPFENIYEGNFTEGKKSGAGKLTLNTGRIITGTWANNELINGVEFYAEDSLLKRYEGNFHHNQPCGQSVVHYKDGSTFEGIWDNGPTSDGFTVFSDGTEYHGQYENHTPCGNGTIIYADGSSYTGMVFGLMRVGTGELKSNDGHVFYKGNFVNNLFNGEGVYTDKGTKLSGLWKEGIFCFGIKVTPEGFIYKGKFRDNQLNGVGSISFMNMHYEGFICRDQMNGKGVLKFNDILLYQGNYKFGLRNGPGEGYLEDFSAYHRGVWHNGQPIVMSHL